ncbi:MAG: 2-isopropylmalate synthase [Clostridia bacterium]|nr:2-isopropylmalate synthase [Clostridia bacterium]
MKNTDKYERQFFAVKPKKRTWIEKEYIDKAPAWCSVDLRDGNQALTVPMSLDEKLAFFRALCETGFKEIEVGFPAASETEYTFLRTLINNKLIPSDVAVQVLTQSREHIIRKTYESLRGCENAIVHLYNSTSKAQREQVFHKSKEEIKKIATDGAKMCLDAEKEFKAKYRYEYSPESFTGTEPDYALEVCNAVLDIWKPTPERKVIINLPVTVELSSPHVYADIIEYFCENIKYRDSVVISLHPHNDRGCAVADSELGLLAGADRIEGTLFGNGERTGNVDIITLALNMYSQGVDPGLDFSDLPELGALYEKTSRMQIYERQPYSGRLVFAAFSGSHQDAIAKAMKYRTENKTYKWNVPYLPLDPKDIGREYETDVIRINSQSGKGGIGYLLERNFGYVMPPLMREDVSYTVKAVSDENHAQLSAEQVHSVFSDIYVNVNAPLKLEDCRFSGKKGASVTLTVEYKGEIKTLKAKGNGRLDAVSNALREGLGIRIADLTYEEHALEKGSTSQAITYVSITADGKKIWGAGIHDDIILSSVNALFSAVNRSLI